MKVGQRHFGVFDQAARGLQAVQFDDPARQSLEGLPSKPHRQRGEGLRPMLVGLVVDPPEQVAEIPLERTQNLDDLPS